MLPAFLVDRIRRLCGYQFPRMGKLGNRLFWKSIPRTMRSEVVPGVEVDLDFADSVCKGTFKNGPRHEKPTLQILEHWLSRAPGPSPYFFDIGSNYGFFSYYLMNRVPLAKAYAFDPNPDTFARLERIRTENELSRFSPQHTGLGDTEGQLDFFPATHNSGDSSFHRRENVEMAAAIQVPVVTFDDWVQQTGLAQPAVPNWVAKIDVEGFEKHVLCGMETMLKARAFSGICLEVLEETLSLFDTSPRELVQLLDDYGYQRVDRIGPWQVPADFGNAFFEPRTSA